MRLAVVFLSVLFMLVCAQCRCAAYPPGEAVINAPEFSLKDLAGSEYSLAGYRNKNSVLLFFWTTWCPYCIQKIKFLNDERVALERKNIILLAVNAGESKRAVERIVRGGNMQYKVLLDEKTEVAGDYGVMGVPTFVLIDKEGFIRYRGNSYPQKQIEALAGGE